MSHICKAIVLLLLIAHQGVIAGDVLELKGFHRLPHEQQKQVFSATYRSALVVIAFENAESHNVSPKLKRFGSCLIDRNEEWVEKVYHEYIALNRELPSASIGAVLGKAMAWRCGAMTRAIK